MASCITAYSANLDMRTHELTYKYTGSIFGKDISAEVICRPVLDTTINGISVSKYQFIKIEPNTIDTSYEYLHITDTSIINYAWVGNTPFILMKKSNFSDSLFLEETPYTTLLFPFKQDATWFTRPESTDLHSIKKFITIESVIVPAGQFNCNSIHTNLLVSFGIDSLYCDQWSTGNVIVKTYINDGENEIRDSFDNPVGKSKDWELFELKSYQEIIPVSDIKNYKIRNSKKIPGSTANPVYTLDGRRCLLQRDMNKHLRLIKISATTIKN